MTDLPEFEELLRDWHEASRARLLDDLRHSVHTDTDLMLAVRNIGRLAGWFECLDSFMTYIQKRRKSEAPETPRELRKVRN